MSFVPTHDNYISQVKLPGSETIYYVKDSEARGWIEELASAGIKFTVAWDGTSTPDVTKIPAGVTVTYSSTTYVGTLAASATTAPYIQLVYKKTTTGGRKIYEEYITVTVPGESGQEDTYFWEEIGDTDISIDDLGDLAFKDSVTLNKQTSTVLTTTTGFSNASSAVTFSGGSSDTFVKSYPGSTNKLATTSIKGVGTDITFNAVSADPGTVTATNTVFGTDTTASKVTTASKTATNLVLGESTTASKATAGTAVSVAKAAGSATNISRISLSTGNTSILEKVSVNGETLEFGSAGVTQGSVTGTNGTESITPYSFSDVTVPVVTSNTSVTFDAVGSATDVTVPVVSSNSAVTASGQITLASKTAATSAANSTVVATGKVAASDSNGDDVLVGLGTATTASAVTGIGTGTAAAQTITVTTSGSGQSATVLNDNTSITVA